MPRPDHGRTFYPALDGLRAVSVLLVLTRHAGDPLWDPLKGYLGVAVFFVISGFLITTLLIEEENEHGNVSLRAFYTRRALRIFPLYYVALAAFSLLVLGAGLGAEPQTYLSRLPYFLLYLNEFASPGTFGHSWSLGIEEKFYLVWPALAFVLPLARRRRLALAVTLAVGCAVAQSTPAAYFAQYTPIAVGCALAVLLLRLPERVKRWAGSPAGWLLAIALSVAAGAVAPDQRAQVLFAVGVAPLVLAAACARPPVTGLLGSGVIGWIGRRSYAIYLFHPIVLSAVDVVVAPGQGPGIAVARMLLVTAGSLLVAEVLYRTVERPCIQVGRRLSTQLRAAKSQGAPPHATTPVSTPVTEGDGLPSASPRA